jgi:hypothetical protein
LKNFANRTYLFCLLNHYLPNTYVYFSLTNPFLIENNDLLKIKLHETFLTIPYYENIFSKLSENIMKAGFNWEKKENAPIKNVFARFASNVKIHDAHLSLFAPHLLTLRQHISYGPISLNHAHSVRASCCRLYFLFLSFYFKNKLLQTLFIHFVYFASFSFSIQLCISCFYGVFCFCFSQTYILKITEMFSCF